jgi:hypothetical protein
MLSNIAFNANLRDRFSGIVLVALMIISCPVLVYGSQTTTQSSRAEATSNAYKVVDANVGDQLSKKLEANIRSDRSLHLVFSHYNDALNYPPIANPATLWVRGKPNVEQIVKLGHSRGADVVILGRLEDMADHSAFVGTVGTGIQLYAIDLDRQEVYRRNGTTRDDIKKLTQKLFAKFIAGRGNERTVASNNTIPTPAATPPS